MAAVGAAPVSVPFGIEYFGLSAELAPGTPPPADHFGEVRFHRQGAWGAWQPLGEDGAQGQDQFTAALVSVDGADGYQVRGLPAAFRGAHAIALNLTDGPATSTSRPLGTPAAAAGATCASRADWNADESITAWSKHTDTMAFAPEQVITVHHTAGSNDPNQNYAATVLAIEQYHVLTNGWSDIGYQYLIDPNGVVYEGRNSGHTSRSCLTGGGDGADFAHNSADDTVVTGAHTGGYNTGNLGIAMIGCFDSTNATCKPTTYGQWDTVPTTAAMASLEQLLARLSTRHGLNPTGTVSYANATNTKAGVPSFTGHRDWEATACPGDNVYSQLPALRTKVAADIVPTGLHATTTDSTAHLSWVPGAAWPSAPRATRYRVRRDNVTRSDTGALTFDDTGLTAATTYSYDVAALAGDGTASAPSAPVSVTTTSSTTTGSASDFTLTANPSTLNTPAGTATSVTVSTTAIGASSTVSLTLSSPAEVTASLGATAIPAGSSTTLQLSTTPAVKSGTYILTLTGTEGSATHSATVSLTITNGAPTASVATSGPLPSGGAAGCSGATCTLAGASRDPEGGATTLSWTMPGGSPAAAGNVASTSVTYSVAGTFTVTLTATDTAGLIGTATAHVTCTRTGKNKSKIGCTATTP